jgi:hypothetical protein
MASGCDRPPATAAPGSVEPPPAAEPVSEPANPVVEPSDTNADAGATALPDAGPPVISLVDPAIADALDKESIFQDLLPVDDAEALRKLDPDLKYGRCGPARLGVADGWFCEVSVPKSEKTGHSVFYIAAVTAPGGKLKELGRFAYQARAMDFPEAIYATLKASYDDATGTLTLTDGAFPCDRATESQDTSLEFQRVVDRLCAARGRHQLKGATFQHKDKKPALVWKGPKRKSAFSP